MEMFQYPLHLKLYGLPLEWLVGRISHAWSFGAASGSMRKLRYISQQIIHRNGAILVNPCLSICVRSLIIFPPIKLLKSLGGDEYPNEKHEIDG